MKKYNLPVILLKKIVLFPYKKLKLEFDSKNIDTNIIDTAINFNDGNILVVSDYNNKIPKIGVLSRIKNYTLLKNNNVRVDIEGIRRVKIIEFLNLTEQNEPLESIVSEIENEEINEELILEKLKKEIKVYTKNIPYVSNGILSSFDKKYNLDKFTDIVVPELFNSDLIKYIEEPNPIKRADMILNKISEDEEMYQIEKEIDEKIQKDLDQAQKEFLLKQKLKVIKKELGENGKDNEIDDLKLKISKLKCNKKIKKKLNFELNRYALSQDNSLESGIIRNYIDWLINLPWNVFTKDNNNLNDVKLKLDESHFGLTDVKERIIEYLAINRLNKNNNTPIICLIGPPGVGKTTLALSIAKAINKKFVKISVNGIKDEAEILGHRRTYISALPGRIIGAMRKAKSSNPLILIDEVDKIGNNCINDVSSTLLNILDKEQNKYFSDNYIEEEYDLSNVLFILTANEIENIPSALKDRLEIVNISGYTEYEKIDITNKYLWPKILKNNCLKKENITLDDDIVLDIIRNYTKESGVRELERQLDKLARKIATYNVIHKTNLKIKITNSDILKYLGNIKYKNNKPSENLIGVVNGLAYTKTGGDIISIEVTYFKGTGKLILTGSLGDILKESAMIALSYFKANYLFYKLNYKIFLENDFHIHIPEGAIKKDGPSAGIAIALAIYSAITNTKIPNNIALTGELTLRGDVLEIGGLKEKSIGALRNNINKIIIPADNDINDLPNEVKNNIEYIKINNFKEIFKIIK